MLLLFFLSEIKNNEKGMERLYILFACTTHRHELVLNALKLNKCPQGAQKSRVDWDISKFLEVNIFAILIFEPCEHIT